MPGGAVGVGATQAVSWGRAVGAVVTARMPPQLGHLTLRPAYSSATRKAFPQIQDTGTGMIALSGDETQGLSHDGVFGLQSGPRVKDGCLSRVAVVVGR